MASGSLFRRVRDLPYSQAPRDRVALANSCKGRLPNFYTCVQLMIFCFASADSKELLQRMKLHKALAVHEGCVNTLCWNSRGDCILSGSDDQRLVITDVFQRKVLLKIYGEKYLIEVFVLQIVAEQKTVHRANIFSAKYLADNDDRIVVSCSGEGLILVTGWKLILLWICMSCAFLFNVYK
jgi:WD40 repeat protein